MTKHAATEAMKVDRLLDSVARPAKVDRLWGAPAIATALGVSVATVYRLAGKADCPIYRPDGRYFAHRHELDLWLRTKVVLDP